MCGMPEDSSIKRRRSSRLSVSDPAPWEVDESKSIVNGLLVDFLFRAPNGRRLTMSVPQTTQNRRSIANLGIQQLLEGEGDGSQASYVAATEQLNLEMLNASLMPDIISFWKARKDPAWTDTKRLFARRARKICDMKREVVCLSSEVKKWMYNLALYHKRTSRAETAAKRRARHQEFWSTFHDGIRRTSAVARTLDDENCDDMSSAVSTQRLTPRSSGGRARVDSGMAWKTRAARSKCSAGSWDWSNQEQRREEEARTMKREQEAARMCLSALGITVEAQPKPDELEDEFEEEELTSSELTPRAKTALLAKSSVLPGSHRWWKRERLWAQADPNQATSTFTLKDEPGFGGMANKTMSLPNLHAARSPRRQPVGNFRFNDREESPGRRAPLPPISKSVAPPWRSKGPAALQRSEQSPTKKYLRACHSSAIVPRPMPFVTGHSSKLKAVGQALADPDLDAVATMMQDMHIEEANLEGNGLLTEKSLVNFVEMLSQPLPSRSLRRLNLSRCSRAGQSVLDATVRLLSNPDGGAIRLRHLNLSSVHIGVRCIVPISNAVRAHPALKSLRIADTGLGGTAVAKSCIGEILGSRTIETLDLGWNCFTEEVFMHLGDRLVEMNTLRTLCLANCSSAGKAEYTTPIVFFIEALTRDNSLTDLDISLNRVDYRCALVVEDALMGCKKLSELNISNNPLGVYGMRSLLRLLTQSVSGLMRFKCEECSTGTTAIPPSDGGKVFSATNPGGRYVLDLTRPYFRSILRMLYKTAERFGLPPEEAFRNMVSSPGPYTHPQKDAHGVLMVPQKGKLSVTFSIDQAMEAALENVPMYDFGQFLKRHYETMRYRPGFRKVIPLFAQWMSIDGSQVEQLVMLDALAKDFTISYAHLEVLCRSRAVLPEIVFRLFPNIEGGQSEHYMAMLLVPTFVDYMRLIRRVETLRMFNPENPNGHYTLDLSNAVDYSVAEQLQLLDRWETGVARRQNRVDTSQKGNFSTVRNEMYQDRPLEANSVSEFKLPECDMFEFDYSSGKRPPTSAPVLDETTFSNILVTLHEAGCEEAHQVKVLRTTAHHMFIQAVQLRSLLGIFRDEVQRMELFVIFFLRVVDMYNEKVFRVRFERDVDVAKLRHRLGYVTMFPFVQPEQAHFDMDFSVYDQRLAACIFVNLAAKESKHNIRDPSLVRADGTLDPLLSGVPMTWQFLDKIPKGGVFSVSYKCAPEERNFKARKQMFEQYGFWRLDATEKEVMWWVGLREVPVDVLEYLEFLLANYGDHDMAGIFRKIDGEDGNGVISLREFEDAYKEMGCHKFAGPGEAARVEAIFRYLDPSGEGQVSEEEWGVMEMLKKEVHLSIIEFVQFCERTFGDDLADAWHFLDGDGSGEIDWDEWCQAVQKVGYFGPAKQVFSHLDKDDEGTVSLDEFELLQSFQDASRAEGSRPMTPHTPLSPKRLTAAAQLFSSMSGQLDG